MKKIAQKTNWERYKNSSEGQEVISIFNHLESLECTTKDMLKAIKRFNPIITNNTSKKEEAQFLKTLDFFNQIIQEEIPSNENDWGNFDHGDFFAWITMCLAVEDENVALMDAPQIGFKQILGSNMFLSFALYKYMPEFFIPNLFIMQFPYFKKIAEKYEFDLPEMPNRSDYRMRWLYYLDMCIAINDFANENGIQDSGELCAFLFDYELTNIKEEMSEMYSKPIPKTPEQAWILVGNYGEGEKNMEYGFWQSNQLTCKGDIMLFYEKSPVKKLNAVWTALDDGFIDPFGHFYSYSIIGRKIVIPDDKAVSFEDFKNSEYFKNRSKEGNYVSKNFQDVSGWSVTSEDYAEIKRMLEQKGFDTSVLPSLYEPELRTDVTIINEKSVEDLLLKPLLEKMGWKRDVDYFQQVEFPSGRGTTKRPDFCLHLTKTGNRIKAKVVIEVKHYMKNNKEIVDAFNQGVSYANWGKAKVFVLCDEKQIRVYEQNQNEDFDENKWKRFRWEEIEILEKFNELKRLLS